jgi:predicted DNA-binding protein (UPF0251 family)
VTRHKLLSGETVSLSDLTRREQAFLRNLQQMIKDGASYFDIERAAIGPGSPALEGRNRVDRRIVTAPLYRLARDIATRAGIAEGLILAPEHAPRRAELANDGTMISVTQAANHLGISRAAVHKAINEKRLLGRHVGNLVIVDRGDCMRYAAERQSSTSTHGKRTLSERSRSEEGFPRPAIAAKGR